MPFDVKTSWVTTLLLERKRYYKLTFAELAQILERDEVAVAAIFYGQARASDEDIRRLSKTFRFDDIEQGQLQAEIGAFPERGRSFEMPPREPLIYRLYEIVQTYGQAYKAILNEKFGDGIMSAIAFSTKVEKETDDKGVEWAVITLRGKWLPYSRF